MGFKRLLSGFNAGGAQIDAVLHQAVTTPGGTLNGVVNIYGGTIPLDVKAVRLDLQAEVEIETQDGERRTDMKFCGVDATRPFQLAPHQPVQFPFQLPVPWEAPLTQVLGQHLAGMRVGVRTQLHVASSLDPGDLDPVGIEPLPSQKGILDAMAALGFRFKSADLERGHVPGQRLPFYQEIEFYPAPHFRGTVNEVELTFLTTPHDLTVIIEVDRRGGILSSGHDATIRFAIPHAQAVNTDFRGVLDHHIRQKAASHGWF